MFVPTCATCHMSGLNGLKVTHDPSERLSYYLANAITEKRPNYADAQASDEADLLAVPHRVGHQSRLRAGGEGRHHDERERAGRPRR